MFDSTTYRTPRFLRRSLIVLIAIASCGVFAVWAAAAPQDRSVRTTLLEPLQPPTGNTQGSFDRRFDKAAAALRRGDCQAADQALASMRQAKAETRRFAFLVSGIYAHVCEDPAAAERYLFAAAPKVENQAIDQLEDWRLFTLSDAAYALGHHPGDRAALSRLLTDHRASPLWERALLRATDHAAEAGDRDYAFELVRWGRSEPRLSAAARAHLDTVAWRLARAAGDPKLEAEAARRLLVHSPLDASVLQVIEGFRQDDGTVRWPRVLSSKGMLLRAQSLLDVGLVPAALGMLDEIPVEDRGFDWSLLSAQALTRAHRSAEALDLLTTLDSTVSADGDDRAAQVAWALAMAELDRASASRGGAGLPPEQRADHHRKGLEQLSRTARLSNDKARSQKALRLLFEELADDDQFEPSMGVLRMLRKIDSRDRTGTSYLFKQGWKQYQARNYTGAIGYWTELWSLYPETNPGRGGRYWSGRSYEALGNRTRAAEVFRELTEADVTDFYRKHSEARLARGSRSGAPTGRQAGKRGEEPPRELWPSDPILARAERLSELGLDELAIAEIDGLGDAAEAKSSAALRSVILARQGKHRDSIPHLRRAFPALAGPFQGSVPARALRLYYPIGHQETVTAVAAETGLPEHLIFGIIRRESAFDRQATSRAGARGLMQLMPATGREIARKLGMRYSSSRLEEPSFNVRVGANYFAQVMRMFDGQVELALAGYNGGPYRIKRLWNQAPAGPEIDTFVEALEIPESKDYVKWTMVFADSYLRLYG